MVDPGNPENRVESAPPENQDIGSVNPPPVNPPPSPVNPEVNPEVSATNPTPNLVNPTPVTATPVNQGMNPVNPSPVNSNPSVTSPTRERPGLVTFAAIMMFVLAGFQIVFAIDEFLSAAWVAANVYGTFGGPLWVWGIIDLAIAALAIYAGYDLLRGGANGRIFGLIIAGFSAVRWFFYLPASPLLALVVIAVDVIIIYGLAINSEYFSQPAPGRRAPV